MNIAYLMNTYPMTSTTFVRREIEALERLSLKIKRYAVRRWSEDLVDPDDIAEQGRTQYLLTNNVGSLLRAVLAESVTNPRRLWKALLACRKLSSNAGGEWIRHGAYLLQAVYLRRVAASDAIDHIHVHFATNAAAVAMLCRILGGPSYSFTVHGPDELVDPARLSLATKVEKAEFVVAISHYCRSQVIWFSGIRNPEKIKVIRCGLPLGEFVPEQDCADSHTLVCVGRICPQKGQAMIPAAVAEVRAMFPSLKVILIGDGEARHEVEQAIVAHDVEDCVEIRGWLPNAQVRELLRSSRGLLLPSFAEGLPIVIMEAFALSRPVVSTYIAGIPELVDRDCGWLVPASSREDLVSAMHGLLSASSKELAAMGKRGRDRVIMFHDLDRSARSLKQNLSDLLLDRV